MKTFLYVLISILLIIFIRDVFFNKKHTIQHNFPIIGHLRYLLELIGPELRQYWVANNREEKPFSRVERSWIFASSKNQNNYQGFGSDSDLNKKGHIFIKPKMIPKQPNEKINDFTNYLYSTPKIIGKKRKHPYHPKSIINISAMSFGSLSAKAVKSLSLGAKISDCYINTGEGGVSEYHKTGADLIFQIGTSYFGVRDEDGSFSMRRLVYMVKENKNIKAIEIKLSQGAKPGKGGVLPKHKITKEIAKIRGIKTNKDIISPSYHSTFKDINGLIDFIENIAKETGLPVGIKSSVGQIENWEELAKTMKKTKKGPDFITIDGGDGGTGAAPPSFSNHVSLPFFEAFPRVYKIFLKYNLTNNVVFIGSGKLGLPSKSITAFAMGVDLINVAREAMFSIGCIQAQRCHTNKCPAGVATQNKWLQSGINENIKSKRYFNYVKNMRKEILEITNSCGYDHPSEIKMNDIEVNTGDYLSTLTLEKIHGYKKPYSE